MFTKLLFKEAFVFLCWKFVHLFLLEFTIFIYTHATSCHLYYCQVLLKLPGVLSELEEMIVYNNMLYLLIFLFSGQENI